MPLPWFVARLRFMLHVRVVLMCVVLSDVLIVRACILDLRVIVYTFAFVRCKVAFPMTRVCRLQVCVWFVVFGLLVCACMIVLRSVVYAFACYTCV